MLTATQTITAHTKPISSISFSPGESLLASSSADSSVKIWRLTSDRTKLETPVKTSLHGHEAGVSAACWSMDSRHLASASDDRTARIWDVETTKTLATLGMMHRSLDAALSTPLSLLEGSSATLGMDDDAAVTTLNPSVESHTGFVSCVAFNPQGSLVATGSHDESVRLWDVRSGRTVALLSAHQEPVVSVQFHPTDGSLLVTGSYDGLVRVWDVASRQCMRSFLTDPAAPVGSAGFTPNGQYVVSAMLDGTVHLWDYMRDICVRSYRGHDNTKFGMQCAFFKEPGTKQPLVACGSEDNRVFMWNIETQEVCSILTGHQHPVITLATHSTRSLLVSGSNREIKMWIPTDDAEHTSKTEGQTSNQHS